MRREQFYVLRLWNDGVSSEDWRLALSPLLGGPARYFSSLADFSRFLVEVSDPASWPQTPPPSGPEA